MFFHNIFGQPNKTSPLSLKLDSNGLCREPLNFLSFFYFYRCHISILNDRVIFNQAAHPNMRTYYFCADTGKEMELWMKAMLDAALVQTEPVKR